MRYYFLFCLYACCGNLSAQNISKKDVLTDLEYLNRAVKYAHPVNYRSVGKVNIDSIIAQVAILYKDSISAVDYRFILGGALQQIGCVHTTVRKNPTIKLKASKPYFFPLRSQLLRDGLFTLNQADSLKEYTGKQILSVNGVPGFTLVRNFLQFSPSDGGGQAFVRGQMDLALESLIALYFGYPEQYVIRFAGNEHPDTIPASPKPLIDSLPKMPPVRLSNKQNALYIHNGIALLKVDGFQLSDRKFFRNAVKEMRKDSIRELILDLRNNPGGNRKAAVVLTQQLIDSSFRYQIVQPKLLQPKMYLSRKGKRQLRLAWIHYHIGDVFRHRRTKDGHTFTYRYNPAKKNFEGNIYVLQNGVTASSATMVTSWLKQYSDAVFIGSRSGGGYNGNNGGSFPSLILPATGIEIKFPVYRLVLDPGSSNNGGLEPDYPVTRSLENYLLKTDKELETALKLINSR